MYVKYFTLLISIMYLIRVLSFIGDVRFNVRGEHVPDCLGRGWGRGLGGFFFFFFFLIQFYVPFKLFHSYRDESIGRWGENWSTRGKTT